MAFLDSDKKPFVVNISMTTILRVLLVLFVLYFIYLIGDILIILFISLILASLIAPWTEWLQKRKIPQGVGVIAIYLVLFSIIGLIIFYKV